MSFLKPASTRNDSHCGWVGVGLRYPHYREALEGTSSIDFVEIHAENFFARGGQIRSLLEEIAQRYEISLHSTSLGLGSAFGINAAYLGKLMELVTRIRPVLVSDHASFAWSSFAGHNVHAGDLLPLEFTEQSLSVLVDNVDRVQQTLGRRILVENLSAYLDLGHSEMSETQYLTRLVERTQCGLLVDLNNLLVNGNNFGPGDPVSTAKQWLMDIPIESVGEIHLAGYSPVPEGELIIDDHSQAVSGECWDLYRFATKRFGPVMTLVEWDNELPDWQTLLNEAEKARKIIAQTRSAEVEGVYES